MVLLTVALTKSTCDNGSVYNYPVRAERVHPVPYVRALAAVLYAFLVGLRMDTAALARSETHSALQTYVPPQTIDGRTEGRRGRHGRTDCAGGDI